MIPFKEMQPERHVLVVLPHPDDETFAFGGVLALHVRGGTPVTYLCGTLGEAGRNMGRPFFATRETLPAIREQELREACAILGISDLRLMGLRDKTIEFEDPEVLAGRILEVIRELRPSRIYTYYPEFGVHPDHNALSAAVLRAVQQMPPSERPVIAGQAFGKKEDVDTLGPRDEEYDLSEVVDQVQAAVRAHASQSQAMLANEEAKMAENAEYRAEVEARRRRGGVWIYPVDSGGVRPARPVEGGPDPSDVVESPTPDSWA
jgi:bacillithiol biosynthesis deacetylase BshB2